MLDRADLGVFYGATPAWRKAAVAARALARRLGSLARLTPPDVWLVQREAFFLGPAWSEWLASRRAPIVFDFDDAIWIRAMSTANARFSWLKNVDKMPRIVAMADTVVAGNDYLASWARTHNDRVVMVPTCVDTDVFTPGPPRSADGPVVIGWSGSPSTIDHLRPLLPVLERVRARFGDRVRIRVMGDPAFTYAPLGLRGEAWTPGDELALLQAMHIGVMPLPDDQWTRGKCGLKGLVSMAAGAATVMSPVGVNTDIVQDGVNGCLATTDDEWFETLCALVDDTTLRERLGAAGRDTVVSRYSVARWSATLVDVLRGAAGRAANPHVAM